jgi:hypothetical protein
MEYSLSALREMENRKYFFTKERFFRYFSILGKKKEEIETYFQLWNRFPNYTDEELETADFVIQKILDYPENGSLCRAYRFGYEYRPNKKRVYYQNGNAIASFEIDLNEWDDVILYAEFLKGKPEVIVAVDFIEELSKNNNSIKVFDGDVFSTSETWGFGKDGEVFMYYRYSYRRLLYTQGRGYIRNGRPDLDERECNHYALTLKDKFQFIGNVYADASFLVDPEAMEEEGENGEA